MWHLHPSKPWGWRGCPRQAEQGEHMWDACARVCRHMRGGSLHGVHVCTGQGQGGRCGCVGLGRVAQPRCGWELWAGHQAFYLSCQERGGWEASEAPGPTDGASSLGALAPVWPLGPKEGGAGHGPGSCPETRGLSWYQSLEGASIWWQWAWYGVSRVPASSVLDSHGLQVLTQSPPSPGIRGKCGDPGVTGGAQGGWGHTGHLQAPLLGPHPAWDSDPPCLPLLWAPA